MCVVIYNNTYTGTVGIPLGLQVVLKILLDLVQVRVMGPKHLQPTLLPSTYIHVIYIYRSYKHVLVF